MKGNNKPTQPPKKAQNPFSFFDFDPTEDLFPEDNYSNNNPHTDLDPDQDDLSNPFSFFKEDPTLKKPEKLAPLYQDLFPPEPDIVFHPPKGAMKVPPPLSTGVDKGPEIAKATQNKNVTKGKAQTVPPPPTHAQSVPPPPTHAQPVPPPPTHSQPVPPPPSIFIPELDPLTPKSTDTKDTASDLRKRAETAEATIKRYEQKLLDANQKIADMKEKEIKQAKEMSNALALIEKNLDAMKTRAETAENQVLILKQKLKLLDAQSDPIIREKTKFALALMQKISGDGQQSLNLLFQGVKDFNLLMETMKNLYKITEDVQ
eukprot:TRINITY_DN16134_c0_g1_i1.p1 TRINITY_DN16134_c0_g1~~TRINITY_DN16134_c0_g1_i1.p1  ORF type:complete len:317 (+),score=118.07 TRINITY_DN16134_c0_g1_i1:1-951(+)